MNETEYLVQQVRSFLDQANYDVEQLSNVSQLMDTICLPSAHSSPNTDSSYPISVNIDVNKYANLTGKYNRCRAIDEALDAMYPVFKRAALNRSEDLDFSVIQFYPNATNRAAFYNLTDLINTAWIKSETILEHVCRITDSVKDYVRVRTTNSTLQERSTQQQQPVGVLGSILGLIDRVLEPIFGLQRRFYWESTNRMEQLQVQISRGVGNIRDGFGTRLRSARDRLGNIFSSSQTNSTSPTNTNGTTRLLNSTITGSSVAQTLISQPPTTSSPTPASNRQSATSSSTSSSTASVAGTSATTNSNTTPTTLI